MKVVDLFLTLPWTIEREDDAYEGVPSVELRVAELPGFVVCGETAEEAEEGFWPALGAFLSSYLDEGEVPPIPESVRLLLMREEPIEDEPASFAEQAAAFLPSAFATTTMMHQRLATA